MRMNPIDIRMLELAAKVAGVPGVYNELFVPTRGTICGVGHDNWNPFINNGDALALGVKRGIMFTPELKSAYERCLVDDMKPSQAMRTAIVQVSIRGLRS